MRIDVEPGFARVLGKKRTARIKAILEKIGQAIMPRTVRFACHTWKDNLGRALMLEAYIDGEISEENGGFQSRLWETEAASGIPWRDDFVLRLEKISRSKSWHGKAST